VDYPAEVLTIVKMAVQKHSDPAEAVAQAERQIRALPTFASLFDTLVRSAVTELVYDHRHLANVAMRRQAGQYGKPGKVVVGASESVNKVYESYYRYRIGATMLGNLTGAELLVVAQTERALAGGHLFNARLCEELGVLVPEEKAVQDVVSEKRLRALFEKLAGKEGVEAA
jgi:hypothetical protein